MCPVHICGPRGEERRREQDFPAGRSAYRGGAQCAPELQEPARFSYACTQASLSKLVALGGLEKPPAEGEPRRLLGGS